jgi:branched-chain amino acid aminotransferase
MTNLCNVNGELVPEAEAKVSVLDRGFLFGDSIYEVIRTRNGIPFAWPEHLERLHGSAVGLGLEIDVADGELTRRIVETLVAAGNAESYVRVIVTRGEGSAPNIDVDYALGKPTIIVMVRPMPALAGRPASVAIVGRLRTDRRALDPGIKSGNYLNNVMGLKEAKARGATDCLFMNSDGRLTEASTSNVWIIKGNAVITPALSAGLLAGVTRRLLFAMCAEQDILCVERDLFEEDIRQADGIFLTSTLRDIAPVDTLDGEATPHCALLDDLVQRFGAYCDKRAEEVYKPALMGL